MDKKLDEKYIREITSQFETLVRSQVERSLDLKKNQGKKDFCNAERIVIGLVDGDGIGPIIMKEARKLLKVLLADEIREKRVVLKDIEGLTIENRLKMNQAVPKEVLAEIKKCDVILKGPTTTPKGGTMESANVTLRRELDLYANIRPVSIPSQNIDWTFFRENTEGEYVLGSKGVEIPETLAVDFKVTTFSGTERIARTAFEYAKDNGKNHVAIVTKANIMKKTDGIFSRISNQVGKEYPEITTEEYYVDIMAANLINEQIRTKFQVFLLPNLYGDIITDEAAQIQGGVGTAGSANVGNRYALFEAIHGSAPRMLEEGLGDYANPSSIFKATEMMLRHIGMKEKADQLNRALYYCNEKEKKVIVTGYEDGAKCSDFSDYVISKL